MGELLRSASEHGMAASPMCSQAAELLQRLALCAKAQGAAASASRE